MSVFDQELILPGTITEILSDYNTGNDTSQFGTTDSVTILGTAFTGPVGKTVDIYSPEHAKYVFGSTFDFPTRREATLVAEIQDAWDKGCRTIHAIRISGDEVYKDFQLASDSECKLRVKGIFPSNQYKNVFFEYNAMDTISEVASGTEASIRIFKPAVNATIEEKMLGKVINENSILVNEVKLRTNWGITKSTRLVDFIEQFNEYSNNNVIRLEIVDNEGANVTQTAEAQGLAFGDMFPGVYFIGRDKNSSKIVPKTELEEVFIPENQRDEVYSGFVGNVFKTLKVNTDIKSNLPIYHRDATELNQLIGTVEDITMIKLFDFLEVPGKVDLVWLKDSIDYEKVKLTDFEMYKLLGKGYANTAKITETKEGTGVYKVVEVTDENNPNRIADLADGIYPILENFKSDYRVLTGRFADTEIKGTLPKKKDFLVSNPVASSIFAKTIRVTPKLKRTDLSTTPKRYAFNLFGIDEEATYLSADAIIDNLYMENGLYKIFKYVMEAESIEYANPEEFEDGEMVYDTSTGLLYRMINGKFVEDVPTIQGEVKTIVSTNGFKQSGLIPMRGTGGGVISDFYNNYEDATFLNEAKYILADIQGKKVVFEVITEDAIVTGVKQIGYLNDLLEESSEMFVTVMPTITERVKLNVVTIRSLNLSITSIEELIILMNNEPSLGKLFTFDMDSSLPELTRYKTIIGEEGIFEGLETDGRVPTEENNLNSNVVELELVDRGMPVYDKNLYIPFKTTDNFARQLAQHCTYTGLKTAPTHGIIGCSKLTASNLKGVADRVDKLTAIDYNLYAKNAKGNDMLDKSNLPHSIGRAVSVTFFQSGVETSDNYTYTSTGASSYAGMVSALPIDQSSTSQPIAISTLAFELTNYQLGRLTQAGYVTVKNSYTQGFVVTDGITMAPATSPLRRLSVTRIINGVGEAIRVAAEPFIGKQNTLANRNSLQTAIKSSLDKMLTKLIESYDFTIVEDKTATRLGIVRINYTIVPIYEIREVRNTVEVKES